MAEEIDVADVAAEVFKEAPAPVAEQAEAAAQVAKQARSKDYAKFAPSRFKENKIAQVINAAIDRFIGPRTGIEAAEHEVGESYTAFGYWAIGADPDQSSAALHPALAAAWATGTYTAAGALKHVSHDQPKTAPPIMPAEDEA